MERKDVSLVLETVRDMWVLTLGPTGQQSLEDIERSYNTLVAEKPEFAAQANDVRGIVHLALQGCIHVVDVTALKTPLNVFVEDLPTEVRREIELWAMGTNSHKVWQLATMSLSRAQQTFGPHYAQIQACLTRKHRLIFGLQLPEYMVVRLKRGEI